MIRQRIRAGHSVIKDKLVRDGELCQQGQQGGQESRGAQVPTSLRAPARSWRGQLGHTSTLRRYGGADRRHYRLCRGGRMRSSRKARSTRRKLSLAFRRQRRSLSNSGSGVRLPGRTCWST